MAAVSKGTAMQDGWQTTTLGEVCVVDKSQAIHKRCHEIESAPSSLFPSNGSNAEST